MAALSNMGVLTMNLFASAGAACAILFAASTSVSAQSMPTKPGTNPGVITISCFRGPSSNVIWDRPNAVFIEDLVRQGYSYPQAHAIGERICRDEWGVNQPEYLKTSLLKIMAETPPR